MRYLLIGLLAVGLMGAGCASYEANPDKPFPNPYVTGQGSGQIFFNDLSAVCTIEISTSTGNLVRTIVESDGDGQATWDMKNESGEDLTGGLYLYIIKSPEGDKKGKIIITK